MGRMERKIVGWFRGLFAFFLICLLLAAAVTYAMQKDLATAILFAVCAMAQMALEIAFPARSCLLDQIPNGREIVDLAQSDATDSSTDDPNLEAIGVKRARRLP